MMTDDGFKYLPAKELAKLLVKLPADCVVSTNQVGNIAVLNTELQYLGFINLSDGSIDLIGEDKDETQ